MAVCGGFRAHQDGRKEILSVGRGGRGGDGEGKKGGYIMLRVPSGVQQTKVPMMCRKVNTEFLRLHKF